MYLCASQNKNHVYYTTTTLSDLHQINATLAAVREVLHQARSMPKPLKTRLLTTPETCSALITADLDYKREEGFFFSCLLADHRVLTVKFDFEIFLNHYERVVLKLFLFSWW